MLVENDAPPRNNRLVSTFLCDLLPVPSFLTLGLGASERDLCRKLLMDEVVAYFAVVLETYRWITWRSLKQESPVINDWCEHVGKPLAAVRLLPYSPALIYRSAPGSPNIIVEQCDSVSGDELVRWLLRQVHCKSQHEPIDPVDAPIHMSFVFREVLTEEQEDGLETLRAIGAQYRGWQTPYHMDEAPPKMFTCATPAP
ncbi:hypothetical protein C27AD_12231 [Salinisphaera hydrothermalis C27AD]